MKRVKYRIISEKNVLHYYFQLLSVYFAFPDIDECKSSPCAPEPNNSCYNFGGSYACICRHEFFPDLEKKSCVQFGMYCNVFTSLNKGILLSAGIRMAFRQTAKVFKGTAGRI